MKIDPYKHKQKYNNWKERVRGGIPELSENNSDIILQYLSDMENGLNVSSKSMKGPRSYIRLNNLKQRIIFLAKLLDKNYDKDLVDLNEEEVVTFFNNMRNGTIRRLDGKQYTSIVDYINPFKAFWHWYMRISRKIGKEVSDITEYLDTSKSKPRWVYLNEKQVKDLCEHAKPIYKAMIMFVYDTGIRSPTELINVKVSDLHENCKKLHIREEIVKKGSFGRKINLMICSDVIKKHIERNGLNPDDSLFDFSPTCVNRYLKRLAKKVLGEGESLAGEKYSNLTMYDFRHCSCCYWLPRYKSESALKYRFGWKKSDKIHYYSELLGMKDTISEDDMLIDMTKTEIERTLLNTQRENAMLKEQMQAMNNDIAKVKTLLQVYISKTKQLEHLKALS